MLEALRLISLASTTESSSPPKVTVDLHPSRPAHRGVATPAGTIALEADPAFEEIEQAGGKIEIHDGAHYVLESCFLTSGEIPRVTEYEHGIKGGVRYMPEVGEWVADELIMDERFVVCHVKGKFSQHPLRTLFPSFDHLLIPYFYYLYYNYFNI